MKFPKKETMRKYIDNHALLCPAPPKANCPICNRIRAYKKALKGVK